MPKQGVSGPKVAVQARRQLSEITGMEAESVSSLRRDGQQHDLLDQAHAGCSQETKW